MAAVMRDALNVSDGPRCWHRMVICARCGCPIAVWESQEVQLVERGIPVQQFHCASVQDCTPAAMTEDARGE